MPELREAGTANLTEAPTCPLTAVEGYMEALRYYRPRGVKVVGGGQLEQGSPRGFPAADMCTVCPGTRVPTPVMVEVCIKQTDLKGLPRTLGAEQPLGLFSLTLSPKTRQEERAPRLNLSWLVTRPDGVAVRR